MIHLQIGSILTFSFCCSRWTFIYKICICILNIHMYIITIIMFIHTYPYTCTQTVLEMLKEALETMGQIRGKRRKMFVLHFTDVQLSCWDDHSAAAEKATQNMRGNSNYQTHLYGEKLQSYGRTVKLGAL